MLYEYLGGDAVCTQLKYRYDRKTPTKFTDSELTPKDRLFMTLLRLRRGIPLRDLKLLFNISEMYASKIVYTWIRFIAEEFKKLEEVMSVSGPAQNGLRPPCFQHFPNLRVVIDCTEFRIQRPKNLQQQRNSYSDYKGASTIKFLIGISCMGGLSYISEGYEGGISDRSLIEKSGFLDLLDSGDAIMADKGFDIEDKCDERGLELLIPSFRRGRDYFTARELMWSRVIAESRVHVETFIGKVKDYRFIRYVIPNSMLSLASDIVKVCAMMVNFQYPFIRIPDEETSNF
ncbi:25-hydroxyvitamin D-1 alpha hydroxylase, mitochondrial [Frankliniella fusca]|uniref:25-hydroxyvitamin D-1 alpha hydroxylase, mitochondrial n=1 Tax=Frankliniella fusca TaxID=407009 RepID=A0AAE1HXE8_9NEOP|nr:25-hydroxyvitamin D-1 alpha hydroxylase, mitochondrial [Frankliniella fusca]